MYLLEDYSIYTYMQVMQPNHKTILFAINIFLKSTLEVLSVVQTNGHEVIASLEYGGQWRDTCNSAISNRHRSCLANHLIIWH